MTRFVRPLGLFVLIICPSLAAAFQNLKTDQVCIAGTAIVPQLKPAPIPAGCEVVDCCPGCPPAKALDWRIKVDTKILNGAELRFEGPVDFKQLKISGNAKVDGNRVLLGPGSSTIGGVPVSAVNKGIVGLASPVVGKDSGARLAKAVSPLDQVTVEQMLGSIRVNLFRWEFALSPCAQQFSGHAVKGMKPHDTIRVTGVPMGGSVVVMADAHSKQPSPTACANDLTWNTTQDVYYDNFRASGGCNSEIAVFGPNTAMLQQLNVKTWTDQTGDLHPTPMLVAPLKVPVNIWIANSNLSCATTDKPTDYMSNAKNAYTANKVGIRFEDKCQDVSASSTTVAAIMKGLAPPGEFGAVVCDDLPSVQASGAYVQGQLNVYFVPGDFTGRSCAIRTTPADALPGDGNIIFIGSGPNWPPNLATLAHEFGHAFGLRPADDGSSGGTIWRGGGHVNSLTGFDQTNLMWGGGPPTRDSLRVGQVFRMNTHTDQWGGTMLIRNGISNLQPRACHPKDVTDKCPELGLKWP